MKKLLFVCMGLSTILLGSCAKEWSVVDQNPTEVNELHVSVGLEGITRQFAKTRVDVPALADEMKVGDLYLLFFEAMADKSGKFVDFVEMKNLQDVGSNGQSLEQDIDMSGTQLDVTAGYNILAIANIGSMDDERYLNNLSVSEWMRQWTDKTEKEVIAESVAWTTGGSVINPDELLMSGRAEKPANVYSVNIPLTRNQVRFDIINKTTTHQLVSVAICNAYPASKIWNDGSGDGALDYSDAMSRIQNYYSYSDASLIMDGNGEYRGYLYAFENQVAMPVQNDRFTTCLVVELRNIAAGTNSFYRINIAPDNSAQMLKRNNSYSVTINSVGDDGQSDATKAYDYPDGNGLDYIINEWDVVGEGVMDQDGSSLLSSPYKTVNLDLFTGNIIGHDANQGQDPRSFNIITFTNNPSGVSGLELIEQKYSLGGSTYNGIVAEIDGNKLRFTRVDVAPIPPTEGSLKSGDKITGTIKLGYAGLRVVINVIQTDLITDFLNLFLPDGGISRFAPFGGIETAPIRVEASGTWTATILSESAGAFGFVGTDALEISSAAGSPAITGNNGNLFALRTLTDNKDEQNAREAFVVVTLDKDPLNFSRLVRVTQQQAANIAITPNQTITFNGTFDANGEPLKGELAAIPNNSISQFVVRPGNSGDETSGTLAQNEWHWKILEVNSDGTDGAIIADEVGGVVDSSKDWFSITALHNTAVSAIDGNTISVDVKGKNTSGSTRKVKLVVYLADATSFTASTNLIQQSSSISLSPSTLPVVSKVGGETQAVSIQADASLKWKLLGITVANSDRLVHHDIKIVDQNNNPIVEGTEYSVATDHFKVVFPKVYYPNRDIPISATVQIGIVGSDLKASITANQTALTAAPMVGWGMTGAPNYGALGDTYDQGWDGRSGSWGLRQISGYKTLGTSASSTTTSINASVDYLHVVPHIAGAAGTRYTWKAVNDYIADRDALTYIVNQDAAGINSINNANSPLKKAGYPNSSYGTDINGVIDTRDAGTKVYDFVFSQGKNTLAPSDITTYWYVDGVNTTMPIDGLPSSAVVLIAKRTSDIGTATPSNRALFIIDVEHKFIWGGESQLFWYNAWLTGNRWKLLDNVMYYVANASKYGSHFTDLLLEPTAGPSGNGDLGDGRVAQPAPWDTTYWGRNVMTEMEK
jgi:hypothetical protein